MTKRDILLQILAELFKDHPVHKPATICAIIEQHYPSPLWGTELPDKVTGQTLAALKNEMSGILAHLVREGILVDSVLHYLQGGTYH